MNTIEFYVWTVFFVLGLILFITGISKFYKKKTKKDISKDAWTCFFEFLACFVLTIPEAIFIKCANVEFWPLRIIQSVLSSLISAFTSNFGNGFLGIEIPGHNTFSSLYSCLRLLTNVGLLMSLGAFISKMLNGPMQLISLSLNKKKKMYVFSSCNNETISIANSIRQTNDSKDYILLFTCDEDCTKQEGFVDLKALHIDETILDVIKKYGSLSSEMEVFIFDDDPTTNLIKVEKTCASLRNVQFNDVTIYVKLSQTPWDLYDNFVEKNNLQDKNIVVNFVRVEETFAYNNLLNNSIFDNAIQDKDYKYINALLIGGTNQRNIEMFKTILHLSQMPDYFLNLTVIDNKKGLDRIRFMMPDLGLDGKGEGDSLYHINYLEGVGFNSTNLDKLIEENASNFTYAFINTEDDFVNIDIALKLKAAALRNKRSIDDFLLQTNIVNKEIMEKWNTKLCEGIQAVGNQEDTFNYHFITNSDIEEMSKEIHNVRYSEEYRSKHSDKEWISYANNEYNRHSVFARTLSYKYKIELLGDDCHLAGRAESVKWENEKELKEIWNNFSTEEIRWKSYEHMRWNVFMRTIGYRYDSSGLLTNSDKTKDGIAKVHKDLVFFEELPLKEKIKDNLQLTDEIIRVLRKQ